MAPIQIDPKLSFGTILTIITLIVAVAAGWARIEQAAQATAAALLAQREVIADHEAGLRLLEREVISSLTEIKQRLAEAERYRAIPSPAR